MTFVTEENARILQLGAGSEVPQATPVIRAKAN